MYDSVKIENFRVFEELNINGLKRVNLFVGKNNTGKTSILEAIELLSSDGSALFRIPRRRGEITLTSEEQSRGDVDIRHIFNGHRLEENSRFQISGQIENKQHFLQYSIVPRNFESQQDVVQEDITQENIFELNDEPISFEKLLSLQIEGSELRQKISIPIFAEGRLDERRLFALTNRSISTIFLGTRGIDSSQLKKIWDLIVLTPKEEKIYEALRSINPNVERIAFTDVLPLPRYRGPATGIMVKFKNADRVPLGSLGDGMRRLLGLAICLVNAENSYLFIDEIDTGLHYSTMEDMWRFVIQTANLFNVQVFATTHSWDCVRALAWLQQERPDLANSVTLHRVDMDESMTMRYSAEELEIAARHHIEVRG